MTTRPHTEKGGRDREKANTKKKRSLLKRIARRRLEEKRAARSWKLLTGLLRLLGKLLLAGLIGFVLTFALYMFNGENKLIYYVIRPLLNKHYDAQVRDRRV